MILKTFPNARLAFGLTWATLNRNEAIPLVEDARSTGEKHKARHAILYESQSQTVAGYWPQTDSPPRNTHSAAALVAQASDGPLIWVARLSDDAWWICHVQANRKLALVRPNRVADNAPTKLDLIVKTSGVIGEVVELATALQSGGESCRVMVIGADAPDHPRFTQATRITWPELLEQVSPTSQIVPLYPPAWRAYVVPALVVVVLVGLYGYVQFDQAAKDQKEAAAAGVSPELASLREERIRDAVQTALTQDTATPSPNAALRACTEIAARLTSIYFGWRVQNASCDPVQGRFSVALTIAYDTATTPNPDALRARAQRDGAAVSFSPDFAAVSIDYPLAILKPRAALTPTELPKHEHYITQVATPLIARRAADPRAMATLGAPTPKPLTFLDPTLRDPATKAETPAPVPTERVYQTISIEATGPGLLRELPFSESYPARLDRIEYSIAPASTRLVLTAFLGA